MLLSGKFVVFLINFVHGCRDKKYKKRIEKQKLTKKPSSIPRSGISVEVTSQC